MKGKAAGMGSPASLETPCCPIIVIYKLINEVVLAMQSELTPRGRERERKFPYLIAISSPEMIECKGKGEIEKRGENEAEEERERENLVFPLFPLSNVKKGNLNKL